MDVLLAIFVNFLTNDKNVNDWLLERGIETKQLIGTFIVFTVLLLVLEYFKFLHNQNSSQPLKDKNKLGITQSQKSGDNSRNYQAGGDININQKDKD